MKNLTFLLIISAFLLNACSTLKVNSDYDKAVDFSKYKTFTYFGWTEESDKLLNDFDKQRVEEAFGAEFKKRDLKLVKENGELVVSLFVQVDQKTETTAYTNHYNTGGYRGYYGGYGYNPGWGWGMGYATTSYQDRDYLVGTLVIDVFDAKTKKLIWQSVGSKTIDENPQTREKNAPKVAAAIMKSFPVKPVKK